MCPGLHDNVITKFVPWGVPGRAYLTVPEGFDLYRSAMPNAGLGIHASTFIKKWTWLGEYDGEIVLPEDGGSISAYTWKVSKCRRYTLSLNNTDMVGLDTNLLILYPGGALPLVGVRIC